MIPAEEISAQSACRVADGAVAEQAVETVGHGGQAGQEERETLTRGPLRVSQLIRAAPRLRAGPARGARRRCRFVRSASSNFLARSLLGGNRGADQSNHIAKIREPRGFCHGRWPSNSTQPTILAETHTLFPPSSTSTLTSASPVLGAQQAFSQPLRHLGVVQIHQVRELLPRACAPGYLVDLIRRTGAAQGRAGEECGPGLPEALGQVMDRPPAETAE